MFYRVWMWPFQKAIESAISKTPTAAGLTVVFEDQHGFQVTTVNVMMSHVTVVHGERSQIGVEFQASSPLSYEDYSRIKKINVRWAGFPD